MKNKQSSLFKILGLYEDVLDISKNVTENDYLSYLDRLYVRYLGVGKEEIYESIQGLRKMGISASHKTVKSVVFHLLDIVSKEGGSNGI